MTTTNQTQVTVDAEALPTEGGPKLLPLAGASADTGASCCGGGSCSIG